MSAASTVAPAPPQHMQALAHANRVRLARASLKRAILANIFTDLRSDPPAHPVIAHAKTTLVCGKSEARDRLRRIADLGFDDALMVVPFGAPEMLDEIRDLLP